MVVPFLDVKFIDPALVSPGYIFVAPFKSIVSVPLIYDEKGELVWAGTDIFAATSGFGPHVYDFHTCNYANATSICALQAHNDGGNARGKGIILNDAYEPVKTVLASGISTSCDLHEFATVDDGTRAIVTQYRRRAFDPADGGPLQFVLEGVFQELEMASGRVVFEWRSLDHVPLSESLLKETQGSRSMPWDYFHINSVEKMRDGNYLVSGRHSSAIYKVSSRDGSIMWQLGGRNSTFPGLDPTFLFQHQARVLSESETETRLSVFDNGWRLYEEPTRSSAGITVRIDHGSRTAQVERRFSGPEVEYLTTVGGSTQVLQPSGNVLVGFGNVGCVAEYTSGGQRALLACVRDRQYRKPQGTLYRAYKTADFVGRPRTAVAAAAFARTKEAPLVVHVSWNGATEVREWRVHAARGGPGAVVFDEVARMEKTGFETTIMATAGRGAESVYVEAVSAEGNVLGRSEVVSPLIPLDPVGANCSDLWCDELIKCHPTAKSGNGAGATLSMIGSRLAERPWAEALVMAVILVPTILLMFRFSRHWLAAVSIKLRGQVPRWR